MPTPQEISILLVSGWKWYSYLVSNDIQKLKDGCGCCGDKNTSCLLYMLNGLEWRYEQDIYDTVTEELYDKIDIIVGEMTTDTITVQFGYFDTAPVPADGIIYMFSKSVVEGAGIYSLDFTSDSDTKYLSVMEPVSEPVKTDWKNTSFNYGTIPDQVWLDTVELAGFRYYVTRRIVSIQQNQSTVDFSV